MRRSLGFFFIVKSVEEAEMDRYQLKCRCVLEAWRLKACGVVERGRRSWRRIAVDHIVSNTSTTWWALMTKDVAYKAHTTRVQPFLATLSATQLTLAINASWLATNPRT